MKATLHGTQITQAIIIVDVNNLRFAMRMIVKVVVIGYLSTISI